jgi:peptidoglycan-associated lipoprotein
MPVASTSGNQEPFLAMTILRIFGLSILLTAFTLSGGCSTLKKRSDAQAPDSGTTASSVSLSSDSAVTTGANESAELNVESLATEAKAAKAGLGAGHNVVHFDYDSDGLSGTDMALLKKHAAFIRANPRAAVQLEGHTDERGTQEYNMALGERRAKAVAVFLRTSGVDGRQLEVISYGELKPVLDSDDEAALARNRRVEIVYR